MVGWFNLRTVLCADQGRVWIVHMSEAIIRCEDMVKFRDAVLGEKSSSISINRFANTKLSAASGPVGNYVRLGRSL